MVRSIAAAVALACAASASPALAVADDEFVKVEGRVSYAGLNLNDSSGAAEFNHRVAEQARHICRRGVPKEFRYGRLVNDCRASVMASGKQQLASLRARDGAASVKALGE